jgi:hypothetical protein
LTGQSMTLLPSLPRERGRLRVEVAARVKPAHDESKVLLIPP